MRDRQEVSFKFHGHEVCPLGYDTTQVDTGDGVVLKLYRCRPNTPTHAPPVLLVPGLGSNRFTFGLTRDDGLPRVLTELGRDVWLAELRGSRSAAVSQHAKARCDVTHKVSHDLPAVVDTVIAMTGAHHLDLIGHSLGGLLALMHSVRDPRVRRVVTVATPGHLEGFAGLLEKTPIFGAVARGLERMVGQLDRVAVSPLARLSGPVPHLAMARHFLPGAVDATTRRRYLDHAVEDVPGPELAQLVRWAASGKLTDGHGRSLGDLGRVQVPVLSVYSTRDKVVSEASARAAHAQIGSRDKALLRIDRSNASRRDYAHADILLAPAARQDVLEPISEWLVAADTERLAARADQPALADLRTKRTA